MENGMPKVIVPSIPETCHDCPLFCFLVYEGYHMCVFSRFTPPDVDIPANYYDKLAVKNKRPDWCPLVLKETYDKNI